MTADLEPYPAMKDPGVPWLGEVPEHWELRRTKTLLRERIEKGFPDEPLLAATQSKGVVRKEQYESRTVVALKDLHLLKLVRIGDFVISLRSFQGGIEHARDQGIISPAYTILYPALPAVHGYLAWLFKSRPYVENLSLYVTGIRQGQNIDYVKLGRAEIPFPPLPEQAAIVRFLAYMDRRIRRYIRAKQKLIKLLEEQKQAIIHRAVTRGLDPDVRLKASGVEWLGDVPEHWEVRPLKHCILQGTSISYGIVQPGEHTPGGVPFVQTGNLTKQEFEPQSLQRTTRDIAAKYPRSLLAAGDVLLGIRASVGMAAVSPPSLRGANISRGIARIAPSASLKGEFVALYLRSRTTQLFWTTFQQGTTFNEIPIGLVRTLPVLVPPIQEQQQIVTAVHEQFRIPDRTIESARKEISLLREYRTRLIADVVTGKLDVREAAARLPDEPEEAEPFDEADDLAELEEESENDLEAVLEEAQG